MCHEISILKMQVSIASLLFVFILIFVDGHKLKTEDLTSEQVNSAAKFATSEIRTQKVKNGELNECEQLKFNVLRGASQALNGVKYTLELKVSSIPSNDENCANKINKSNSQFKSEICEVEVWLHSHKNPHPFEFLRSTCLKIED